MAQFFWVCGCAGGCLPCFKQLQATQEASQNQKSGTPGSNKIVVRRGGIYSLEGVTNASEQVLPAGNWYASGVNRRRFPIFPGADVKSGSRTFPTAKIDELEELRPEPVLTPEIAL